MTGTKLRSNSEAVIANWLTLHGVTWKYERPYDLDTATLQYGQYEPDFYLPEHDVYIEHWACDEEGGLPEDWSPREQDNYKLSMEWKRALHQRSQTTLVETYSSVEGRYAIVPRLIAQLNNLGIEPEPISEEQLNAWCQLMR